MARAAWLVLFAVLGLTLARVPQVVQDSPDDQAGTSARIYAVLTWVYVAGFGSAAIPVASYLIQNERLPSFLGIFDMYGGPRALQLETATLVLVLFSFLGVTLVSAWASWLIWDGFKSGALISLVLVPVEAAYWFVFSHPRSSGPVVIHPVWCHPERSVRNRRARGTGVL